MKMTLLISTKTTIKTLLQTFIMRSTAATIMRMENSPSTNYSISLTKSRALVEMMTMNTMYSTVQMTASNTPTIRVEFFVQKVV